MDEILTDPIVRRELGLSISNAAVGLLLALVLGIAASLAWLLVVVAALAFGVAAVTDRHPAGGALSYAMVGVVALLFVGLWLSGGPILGAIPLVILGTALGFGCNRLLFGVVRSVPERRRERAA